MNSPLRVGGADSSGTYRPESSEISSDEVSIKVKGGSRLNRLRQFFGRVKARAKSVGSDQHEIVTKNRKIMQSSRLSVLRAKRTVGPRSYAGHVPESPGSPKTVDVSSDELFEELAHARSKLRNVFRHARFKLGGVDKSKQFMREGFARGYRAGLRSAAKFGPGVQLSPSLENSNISKVRAAVNRGSPQAAFRAAYAEGFKRGLNTRAASIKNAN